MNILSDVVCTDDYSRASTIDEVYGARGGYAIISGADVYMQRQFGDVGRTAWTDEVHVGQGNVSFEHGTVGVRFRNFVPGAQATVSAEITLPAWPGFALAASGAASPLVSGLPVVNPQSYGAKFDGVTDDLGAIIVALGKIPAGGGILYLPGIAGISSALDLTTHPGIVVAGPLALGPGVTYPAVGGLKAIPGFPANTPLIRMSYGAVTDPRTLICGLSLDGNNLARDGIEGVNISGPRVVGCSVVNTLRDGFHFTGAGSNSEMFDCYVNHAANAAYYVEGVFDRLVRCHCDGGNYGILVNGASGNAGNILIDGCHLDTVGIAAIRLQAIAGGARIANCFGIVANGGTGGLVVDAGAFQQGVKVANCGFTGGATGVGISLPSEGVIVGCTIGGFSRSIDAGDGVEVIGCDMTLAAAEGVRSTSAGTVIIVGNKITDAPAAITNPGGGTLLLAQNNYTGTVVSTFTAFAGYGAGWADLGGGNRASGYIRNPDRTVTVVVEVAGNTIGTITTLPVGFRPTGTVHFVARGDDGVGTSVLFGRITPAGLIIADSVRAGANPQLAFSLTFPVQ